MIKITIPSGELFNEDTNEILYVKECTLQLEHSLISVSKWESKWNKPFLSSEKTYEQTVDYVRCMNITQNIDDNVYLRLTKSNMDEIAKYIDAPMTATWFNEDNKSRPNKEIVTTELIYYWMIALQIPFECQKWHLNRLLTLIKVCNIKNQPPKKMSKSQLLNQYKSINESRRAALKK